MKKTVLLTIIPVILLGFFACWDDHCDEGAVVKAEKTLSFSGVNDLSLDNITGQVKFIGWDKDNVQVYYKKQACGEERLSNLKVSCDQDQGHLEIDTDYPRRCNQCKVEFTVHIPKSFQGIKARNITGSITFDGTDFIKMVDAECITGSIKAGFSSEKVYLKSVTGGLSLDLIKLPAEGGDYKLSLTTGSIKIYAPEDFTGNVDFKTVTGRVTTDFPVTMRGNIKRNRLNGTIGSGGTLSITARTVTGSIRLIKNQR